MIKMTVNVKLPEGAVVVDNYNVPGSFSTVLKKVLKVSPKEYAAATGWPYRKIVHWCKTGVPKHEWKSVKETEYRWAEIVKAEIVPISTDFNKARRRAPIILGTEDFENGLYKLKK